MTIIEIERVTKRGETVSLILETPLGTLTIYPTNIEFSRDNGNHTVEIHKNGCWVRKHQKAHHDEFDLDDRPWKAVYINLGEEDRISVNRSNSPWELSIGNSKKIKLYESDINRR